MYTSIIGELEFIFQALGNLVAEGDLEDAIAERLLAMATQGHSTLVLAQSLPERIFVQPITLGVIVQYRMSPLAGNDNILAAFDVYRVTEDRTDFLDTVQAIIERDDWTHAV